MWELLKEVGNVPQRKAVDSLVCDVKSQCPLSLIQLMVTT